MGLLDFVPVIGPALDAVSGALSESNARGAFKTRYQDTVADLKAAGLNPALAYGQGGGSPQTAPLPDIGSSLSRASQTGASAKQAEAQANNTNAQTRLLNAQADDLIQGLRLKNQALGADIENTKARTITEGYRPGDLASQMQRNMASALTEQTRQALNTAMAVNAQNDADWYQKSNAEMLKQLRQNTRLKDLDINTTDIENYLLERQKPQAEAESNYYKGIGKYAPYVSGAKDVASTLGEFMPRLHFNLGGSSAKSGSYFNPYRPRNR